MLSVVQCSRIFSIPDPLSNVKCKDVKVDQKQHHTVSMFQIYATLVTAMLLLLAKDVETIQKPPGMY